MLRMKCTHHPVYGDATFADRWQPASHRAVSGRGRNMRRFIVLLGIALVAGCASLPEAAPPPAPVVLPPEIVRAGNKLMNRWYECLQRAARTSRANRTTAAEMALTVCVTQEKELAKFLDEHNSPTFAPLSQLKPEARRLLTEKRPLPSYPED